MRSQPDAPVGASMLTGSIWYRVVATEDPSWIRGPVESLARSGLSLRQGEPEAASGPGILFFDEITARLLMELRDLSRGGIERVLAVAVSRSALPEPSGWLLLQHGASDAFALDHSPDPAGEIAARFQRWDLVDRLVNSPLVRNNLLGDSHVCRAVLRQAVEVGRFTDASVLILGESGTGKELIARLIHSLDPRPHKRNLVVLDCVTVVPELAGSEFFGHERGAFTGAVGSRNGAFALAHGGTLFLDEIGDLPVHLQAQLLRAVQEHTYKRVGGDSWHTSEFRLICATNRPLLEAIEEGTFRADLYYRIAGVVCRLPPLRERSEDIVPLFRHFLAQWTCEEEPPELDEPVRRFLVQRSYPGNIRDLKQLAARVAYRHVGPGPITIGDIPEDERLHVDDERTWWDAAFDASIRRALEYGIGLKEISRVAADAAIRIAVGDAAGNLQQAAQRLGVTDRALQMRRAAGQHPVADDPGQRGAGGAVGGYHA
jgi:transcriptional regulator with GAF, ATPase, and Fis domain